MGSLGLLVILTLLAILVVAVLASIWLVRNLREGGGSAALSRDGSGAHEALRRRYAAGEIDDDEYERRLSGLGRR
jgi:putative membrane protein